MKNLFLNVLLCSLFSLGAKAQIGYQVSLLNTATGEPRANVTVNATATITDSKGGVLYTGTQKVTSNDFGVLSLTVGNAETFRGIDFAKMPFFIEVSVDGKSIGKSQILNVPVAEAAKTLVPAITKEELCSKEWVTDPYEKPYDKFSFNENGTCNWYKHGSIRVCKYEIEGNNIYVYYTTEHDGIFDTLTHLRYFNGKLWLND